MNLTEVSKNNTTMIEGLVGAPELILRLAELGFTQGVQVKVVGRSLFKSPIYVEVRGAVIALRTGEAECIQVR